jgi:hypothetical protein
VELLEAVSGNAGSSDKPRIGMRRKRFVVSIKNLLYVFVLSNVHYSPTTHIRYQWMTVVVGDL